MSATQCLCPQGQLQLPCLSETSKDMGTSGPGFYQITAFPLGLTAYMRFCAVRVKSVSPTSPLGLLEIKSHWSSMPNALEACLPGAGTPNWRAQCGSQNTHSCGRSSALNLFSKFLVIGVDYIMTLFLLLHLIVGPSLYLKL